MRKKLFALALVSAFFLLVFTGLASAYYYVYNPYGYGDHYDSYSYHSSRTSGYGGYLTTRTTDYDRVRERYWNGYDWVDRTVYVKETRESPYYGYGYGGYGGYGYDPWYQKYWDRPYYGYGGYGNYYSYGNYYPSYRTNW